VSQSHGSQEEVDEEVQQEVNQQEKEVNFIETNGLILVRRGF
jgi:hypothetical protein